MVVRSPWGSGWTDPNGNFHYKEFRSKKAMDKWNGAQSARDDKIIARGYEKQSDKEMRQFERSRARKTGGASTSAPRGRVPFIDADYSEPGGSVSLDLEVVAALGIILGIIVALLGLLLAWFVPFVRGLDNFIRQMDGPSAQHVSGPLDSWAPAAPILITTGICIVVVSLLPRMSRLLREGSNRRRVRRRVASNGAAHAGGPTETSESAVLPVVPHTPAAQPTPSRSADLSVLADWLVREPNSVRDGDRWHVKMSDPSTGRTERAWGDTAEEAAANAKFRAGKQGWVFEERPLDWTGSPAGQTRAVPEFAVQTEPPVPPVMCERDALRSRLEGELVALENAVGPGVPDAVSVAQLSLRLKSLAEQVRADGTSDQRIRVNALAKRLGIRSGA